ncbi:helix-turn-helix domain-containing protein [Micromonospora haikouensis]|uniref:helix-turn-helix domain-containing protein n=1 Tax=Micromonospora haikouensis TaxID=686309 RepID=UPI00368B4A07
MTHQARTPRAHTQRQALGRRLRAHRLARGLTQADVMTHTRTGKAQMYSAENAAQDVTTGTLIDIAAAVGLHVALAGDHHLPLLDLTAAEVQALIVAASSWAALATDEAEKPADGPDPQLLAALDRLTPDADTYDPAYPLDACRPADTTPAARTTKETR